MRTRSALLYSAAVISSAVIAAPRAAEACGGFFCNNLAPVVQSGESILFSVQDGMVEAHVQVLYEGPSESFAWIVPTPSRPEVGVSHSRIFSALQPRLVTRPAWEFTTEGTCYQPPYCPPDYDDDGPWPGPAQDAGSADTASDGGATGGVTVVEQDNVGPYDYVVLQASSVEPLFEWLEANDYDIPEVVAPFVEPYILMDDDVHFVAFRLSKERDTGDIVPVVLTYESNEPMIPIQLTAIASTGVLPIHVYLLGESRAVPENYLHVVPNPVFGSPGWYGAGELAIEDLVREAGGQAFITHYAGSTSQVASAVYAPFMEPPVFDEDARVEFVLSEIGAWLSRTGLGLDATVLGVMGRTIDLGPTAAGNGIDFAQALNCPFCFSFDDGAVNVEALNTGLREAVVEPLAHVQGLVDEANTITYLATVMEPEHMTADPYFTFNPDLPDVSNTPRVRAVQVCGRGRAPWLAPWRLEFASGEVLWGYTASDSVPRVSPILRVEELGAAGPAMVVSSNAESIQLAIDERNARVRAERDFDPTEPPGPVSCDDNPAAWTPPTAIDTAPGEQVAYPRAPGRWRFDEERGWVRIDEPGQSDERGCMAAGGTGGAGALASWFVVLLGGVYRRRASRTGSHS